MKYAAAVLLIGTLAAPGTCFAAPEKLIPDQPTGIDGVTAVCTGSSLDARTDPKWRDYSVRLEFADKEGQYLGDELVRVMGEGKDFALSCPGPWVLMQLPAGSYKVTANIPGKRNKEFTLRAPTHVVMHF